MKSLNSIFTLLLIISLLIVSFPLDRNERTNNVLSSTEFVWSDGTEEYAPLNFTTTNIFSFLAILPSNFNTTSFVRRNKNDNNGSIVEKAQFFDNSRFPKSNKIIDVSSILHRQQPRIIYRMSSESDDDDSCSA